MKVILTAYVVNEESDTTWSSNAVLSHDGSNADRVDKLITDTARQAAFMELGMTAGEIVSNARQSEFAKLVIAWKQ